MVGRASSAELQLALLRFVLRLGGSSVLLYGLVDVFLGLYSAALVEGLFLLEVVATLLWLRRPGRALRPVVWVQILAVTLTVTSVTLVMGGPLRSAGFPVWQLLVPMAALVFFDRHHQWALSAASVAVVAGLTLAEPWIVPLDPLPASLQGPFFALNVVCGGGIVLATLVHFSNRLSTQERAARASEANYRATVDNIPSAVALKAADGRYVLVSRGFEALYGLPAAEVVGRTDAEVFPPEVASAAAREETRARALGRPVETDETVVLGGVARDIHSVRIPLPLDAGTEAVTCWVATDVTECKRLQDEVLRAQKLDSLCTLAGGVAHDFNNVLTACLGNLELAAQALPPSHEARELLGEALHALGLTASLTRQLRTLSRGGAPVRAPVRIGATVREQTSLVLRGTNVRGEVTADPDLPPVNADLGQVGQLIQNLVLNAVQAMPAGGTVRVTCDVVAAAPRLPGLTESRPYLRLRVADDGPGIPESQRARVFDPYFTTKRTGKGLGLATCYSIARGHDGGIEVESTEGRGATFSVYLPVFDGPLPLAAPAPCTTAPLDGLHVLVMDDEEVVRAVVTRMLHTLRCTVTCASEGQTAIDLYAAAHRKGARFDAVLLDLTVTGGMGGVEAARGILALDPTACLVAASGYVDSPVMARKADYGFRGTLQKPFSPGDLAAVLAGVRAPTGASD